MLQGTITLKFRTPRVRTVVQASTHVCGVATGDNRDAQTT